MDRNYIFVQTRLYNYIFVCTWYNMYIPCIYRVYIPVHVQTCLYMVQTCLYRFAKSCPGGQDSRCGTPADSLRPHCGYLRRPGVQRELLAASLSA